MANMKMKASQNRVRTSVALQGNSMWQKTIGVEANPQSGSNAAVEAALRAPGGGAGGGRAAKQAAALALIEKTGVNQQVTDFDGLLALAKKQGSVGDSTRGACKVCGGLGHLTRQCKNYLSDFYGVEDQIEVPASLVAAAQLPESDHSIDTSEDEREERRRKKRRKREKKEEKRRKKYRKEKKRRREDRSREDGEASDDDRRSKKRKRRREKSRSRSRSRSSSFSD